MKRLAAIIAIAVIGLSACSSSTQSDPEDVWAQYQMVAQKIAVPLNAIGKAPNVLADDVSPVRPVPAELTTLGNQLIDDAREGTALPYYDGPNSSSVNDYWDWAMSELTQVGHSFVLGEFTAVQSDLLDKAAANLDKVNAAKNG